jgi:hypothetical protein
MPSPGSHAILYLGINPGISAGHPAALEHYDTLRRAAGFAEFANSTPFFGGSLDHDGAPSLTAQPVTIVALKSEACNLSANLFIIGTRSFTVNFAWRWPPHKAPEKPANFLRQSKRRGQGAPRWAPPCVFSCGALAGYLWEEHRRAPFRSSGAK